MKFQLIPVLALAGITFALAGCGDKPAENANPETAATPSVTTAASPAAATPAAGTTTAATTSKPKGTLKVGDMAICAVCAVKEGTKEPEHVKDVLDYKDQTYGFCNESEKAEFISDPAKYVAAK